jgi:prevent-host-death family protein
MADIESISVTEFKAKCLDILDRVSRRELERVTVTKRGKVVAIVTPPETEAWRVRQLHGFMRGSVVTHQDIDLTKPILDEPFAAETGKLHR